MIGGAIGTVLVGAGLTPSVAKEMFRDAFGAKTVAFTGFAIDLGALNTRYFFVYWLQEEVLLAFCAETVVTTFTI